MNATPPDLEYFLRKQPRQRRASDAIEIHAPERGEKRQCWAKYSRAARPDLLAWDYGLNWTWLHEVGGTERLSEQLSALQYLRLDTRYTVVPTRREALELMMLISVELPDWFVVEHGNTPLPYEAVVYTSEYGGHVGQDKEKLRPTEQPAELLASRFMPCDELPLALRSQLPMQWRREKLVWSERDFILGNWLMKGTFVSPQWRSNVECIDAFWEPPRPLECGDLGSTSALRALCGPLYAVDYVISGGQRYALDFNTCPGATGAIFPAPSIAEAARDWHGWLELA